MVNFFMRYIVFAVLALVSCETTSNGKQDKSGQVMIDTIVRDTQPKQQPKNADSLVIPGERIGKVALDMDAAWLDSILGKPAKSDAAMGKAFLTWNVGRSLNTKQAELVVYTAYRNNNLQAKSVQQLQTTSPAYQLTTHIGVGCSLAQIQDAFPGVSHLADYKEDGQEKQLFDEAAGGIAFEITKNGNFHICTRMIIHGKGKPMLPVYKMLHHSIN